MNFLKNLFFFLSLSSMFCIIFNKKFEKCLVYSIFFSSFILYISQLLFKTFNVGFYVLLALCFFNIILLVIEYRKNKLKCFKNNFFNYGFYAFLIIFSFIIIYDLRRVFTHWDEFSHWGVMIKEMFRLDCFYTENISSLMVHKDYPPIFQIYELLNIKLYGTYSETIILRSLHLFEFSIFLYPISEIVNKSNVKKYLKVLLIPVIVLLIIITFDGHSIVNTIYVDYIMALIVAFGIFLVLDTKKYDLFNISLFVMNNSFLLLIKQMGLPLYLIICLFLILKLFIDNYDCKNDKIIYFIKNNIKKIIVLIIILFIPFLFNISWNKYINNYNIEKQFIFSDIKISQLFDIGKGNKGEQWQKDALFNYKNALFSKNITTSVIKLSFIQSLIICLFLLKYVLNKYYEFKYVILLLVCILIGSVGYSFVMLNLYVFCFGPLEGPNLASFDRYMSTYILIILFLSLLIYIKNNNNINHFIILLIILVLIQSPDRFLDLNPVINAAPKSVYEMHAKQIDKYAKKGDKVFIVAQDSTGDYQFYIKYYLDGIKTNLDYFSLDLEKSDSKNYINKLKLYMNDYDFVYIAKINEKYIEKYSFLFDNSNIQEGQVYKIKNKKGNLQLKLVNV